MQGSQEGKRPKLWGPRAHFGTNISMKIVVLLVMSKPFAFLPIWLPSSSSLRKLPILKVDNYIYVRCKIVTQATRHMTLPLNNFHGSREEKRNGQ